jgi:cyclopropane-fatty-acyl-phospholipid synthase
MTYSCAFFEREDMTLEEAQLAKIDLALGKCQLQPGMKLLDVGCGWGATLRRAAEHYGVHATGLTLSRNQYEYASHMLANSSLAPGSTEVRLQGWEEFDEPVDRIVSIGAFEHFRQERYDDFFAKCRRLLPSGGRMLLHTILIRGLRKLHEHILFCKFIAREIFPGGHLCEEHTVIEHAERAGFLVERIQSLQPHYARTLDLWAANLRARREAAIALTSREVYDRYMHYLTGCADAFRSGHTDVMQFTLAVGQKRRAR